MTTSDGGATWRTVLSHDGNLWAIAVDPAGTVYVVGTDGVLVTADRGRTWRSAGTAPADNLDSLVIHPSRPGTLYAVLLERGVFRTSDGGRTWRALGVAPRQGRSRSTRGHRRRSTWAALTGSRRPSTAERRGTRPTRASSRRAGRSHRTRATRTPCTREPTVGCTGAATEAGPGKSSGSSGAISAVAVDPREHAHSGSRWGGTSERGVLISTNGGRTWAKAAGSTGNRVSAIVFDPHHPGTVFAAAWGAGVIRAATVASPGTGPHAARPGSERSPSTRSDPGRSTANSNGALPQHRWRLLLEAAPHTPELRGPGARLRSVRPADALRLDRRPASSGALSTHLARNGGHTGSS